MNTVVHVTFDQYDAMINRGVFEAEGGHRVELIEGEIIAMSPIGEPHEGPIDRFVRWSDLQGPSRAILVRVQQTLGIPELDSVPQPDVAKVGLRAYPVRPQASDVLLLVEVADSSLATDRGRKARIYARAGIADYWIVNIPDRCVEVRRHPVEGVYRSIAIHRPGDSSPSLPSPRSPLPSTNDSRTTNRPERA